MATLEEEEEEKSAVLSLELVVAMGTATVRESLALDVL